MDLFEILSLGLNALILAASLFLCLYFMHMFQQKGYKLNEFWAWLKKNAFKVLFIPLIAALILNSILIFSNIFVKWLSLVILGICPLVIFYLYFTLKVKQAKKPLVFTARIKRLLLTVIIIHIIIFISFYLYSKYSYQPFMIVLCPFIVILASLVNSPVETAIQNHYLKDAKNILSRRPDLIKIGITGSYGKTSAKFFLSTILGEKFNVCTPVGSYNTPMGLTRVVREQLKDTDEVLIAEMGARYVGDIAELCELINPKIGLITSVGPQHLETFKSIDNIKKTKYELIQSLPVGGFAVFNGDNEYCLEYNEKCEISHCLFGIDGEDLYVRANDINVDENGSAFKLILEDKIEVACRTKLLGRHNVLNIAGAAAVAYHLGLTPDDIQNGISKLRSVEHRLELLPTNNGITVIDDAFNSNPQGAAVALDVLSNFAGRKIVITPGMVELGSEEDGENRHFGRKMALVADVVLLIGKKRTAPILEGLKSLNFNTSNIHVFDNLAQATEFLPKLTKPGDVILFENDLPDIYDE